MVQEKLINQRIGVRLARVGMLSKAFAIQTFNKLNIEITPEQFIILMALNDNDGIYQRQLANMTFKDRPNINRIVSILERGKYIVSQSSSNGRQIKQLFITDKGKSICNKILPIIFDVWNTTTKGLEENEIEQFINTLQKIEQNLRDNTFLQV